MAEKKELDPVIRAYLSSLGKKGADDGVAKGFAVQGHDAAVKAAKARYAKETREQMMARVMKSAATRKARRLAKEQASTKA